MNPSNISIEALFNAYTELKAQFQGAQTQITGLQNALAGTRDELNIAQNQLRSSQAPMDPQALLGAMASSHAAGPKIRRPDPFRGKGSVSSWVRHMDNYLEGTSGPKALSIAVSYLEGSAHEWWIVFKTTEEGRDITSWDQFQEALINRFQTLNKSKIARDKLAKWKQVKDVPTFNDDFLKIVLDIPNISVEEQVDRYTRGLKPHIWKELCTREYTKLSDAMRDAERVEAAHKRIPRTRPTTTPTRTDSGPTPMDIGNVVLKKLTPAERDQCKKEGKCFRCRQKGHMANKCPKARGN